MSRIVALISILALTGCAGQERMTGREIGCATRDVTIIPSAFSNKGMKTAWCATCRDKVYRCATNAQRTRTVCTQSKEGDGCQ